MQPLGVHHVSINVTDVQEALTFYAEVLGLAPRTDRPDFGFGGAWLDAGAQQVHLIEAPAPDARGQHFAIRIEGIDDVVAEIRRCGVEVSDPVPVGGSRQAFLHDPAGNAIELHQVGGADS
ncbi:MAG: VOC family protein [Acidimicrobiales bacterium]